MFKVKNLAPVLLPIATIGMMKRISQKEDNKENHTEPVLSPSPTSVTSFPPPFSFYPQENGRISLQRIPLELITQSSKISPRQNFIEPNIRNNMKVVDKFVPFKEFNVDKYQVNEQNSLVESNYHKKGHWNVAENGVDPWHKIPWKIHVYVDNNEEDYKKMTSAIVPYLNDREDAKFKTMNPDSLVDMDNINKDQKGKGIVVYPTSKAHFEEISTHISQIIQKNQLELKNTSIVGDKQMGNTGRLFYRFDDSTGATYNYNPLTGEETHYDPSRDDDGIFSTKTYYQSNRGDSPNAYLADDMEESDDPFLNFNPDLQ